MKINSRSIQAQPALTSCTEMEEGWRGWAPPDISSAMSPAVVWGWVRKGGRVWAGEPPFQFPGERQWVVSHRGIPQICLKRFPSLICFTLFAPPDTSLKIFQAVPHFAKLLLYWSPQSKACPTRSISGYHPDLPCPTDVNVL